MKTSVLLLSIFTGILLSATIATAQPGNITTVAGDGVGGFSGDGNLAIYAQLGGPSGIAIDTAGNLYIADYATNHIP